MSKTRPVIRIGVVLLGVGFIMALAHWVTGSILPSDPRESLVYQTGLLMLVLGSALVEHKFTKATDALINALAGIVTLLPVRTISPEAGWWTMVVYTIIVLVLAITCVAVSDGPHITGLQAKVANVAYRLATTLGRAKVYFSLLLLFALWSFFWPNDIRIVLVVVFWGLYLALSAVDLPGALVRVLGKERSASGSIIRTEWPNILRVTLGSEASWTPGEAKVCRQIDGSIGWVLPLYSELHTDQIIGTGLFVAAGSIEPDDPSLEEGRVYDPREGKHPSEAQLSIALGVPEGSRLIGFVVEDSAIGFIRFETWNSDICKEGGLVWVNVHGKPVYYQIVDGITREESSDSNRRGFQVALAVQIGEVNYERGFLKYAWLPPMNAPVYGVPEGFGKDALKADESSVTLGTVPSTSLPVRLSLGEALNHHIAILGVTGSGKTELAFDLLRSAIARGTKVVCVDLTARYAERLRDLKPTILSLDDAVGKELSAKLFAVETGQYGAGNEKKALEGFASKLKEDVGGKIKSFLESKDDAGRVGVVSLPDISNTKATLYITELYLTLLLQYAKDNGSKSPSILVVLEEAHTIIPESSTMGLGDFDSKGLVGKMAQIALQGRKYRVGLMVIAQRTATVSKTVLTQCNTVISFSCIDDTSISFLSNVYGSSYAKLLPNLAPLNGIVFGKGLRSQRPLIFEVAFDAAKAEKS